MTPPAQGTQRPDLPAGRRLLALGEYAIFRAVMALFRLIGLRAASGLGGAIARTVGPRLSLSRRADQALARTMPGLDAAARAQIIRDMWDNLGRTFGEYAHFDALARMGGDGVLHVEGVEHIDRVRAEGRAIMLVSGHFANWETMPMMARLYGLPAVSVYREVNNPYVDRWITAQRRAHGSPRQFAKGADGARKIVEVLKGGEVLLMLVDQKLNDGLPVPFFGIPAMTATAPAQLALKYDAALVPVHVVRHPGPRFVARVYPEITVPRDLARPQAVLAMLSAMNAWLEARIREQPAQWLWLHRRWPKPGEEPGRPRAAARTAAVSPPASGRPPVRDPDAPETN